MTLAQAAQPLATQDTFLWGVLGALMALAAVQGLTVARALARRELRLQRDLQQAVGIVGFVLMFLGLGGGVAVLLGDATEPKHAIAYGLGWQAILGGYIKGAA